MRMRIEAENHTIVLTPITGQPTKPGRYLGVVPRYEGHRDGPGCDAVVVEWALAGRTGELYPTAACPRALWTHRVTVEAGPAEQGVGLQGGLTREETGHVLGAIQHVLTRAQIDVDLGYHLGPLTQSFEKLVEAEATITGRPLAEVRAARARSMTTDKPRVKQLEAQVYRLEAQLERLGAIPDGSPE